MHTAGDMMKKKKELFDGEFRLILINRFEKNKLIYFRFRFDERCFLFEFFRLFFFFFDFSK